MKLFMFLIGLAFISGAMANDNVCSRTRACHEDKNCKIYAFKHNCHGICQSKTITDDVGKSIQCPMQCACLKVKVQEKNA